MPHPRFSSEEIARRGQELYEKSIRAKVETEENIGKLVSIDIETGDYEIGEDNSLEAPRRLHAKHPGAHRLMMTGRVEALHALLPITFRLPGQPDISIEFVVDTGFTGALTLPLPAVTALKLLYSEETYANLATDQDVALPVYEAT